MKKRVVSFAMAVVTVMALIPAITVTASASSQARGFYVSETTLYDANGNEFIMRGVNHSHTWFKNATEIAIPAIAATGSNTVRIVLSNGEWVNAHDGWRWERDSAEVVRNIIELCKKHEMIAVLEVHDATGKNEITDLRKIVDYWIDIKDVLIGQEAYVIINIANEWLSGDSDAMNELWRDGYIEAISRLREAGFTHTLMVDAAGYGQGAQSVFQYGREVFEADKLKNTMFSIHMYCVAGKDAATVRANIDGALAVNVPLVIGEFGHIHGGVKVAFETILSYSEQRGVGYLAWAWFHGDESVGAADSLNIALDWDGNRLSSDWGEILINSRNGIRATSVKATVFSKLSLTTADALAVLRAAVGLGTLTSEQHDRFNLHGSATTADALRILRTAVGL